MLKFHNLNFVRIARATKIRARKGNNKWCLQYRHEREISLLNRLHLYSRLWLASKMTFEIWTKQTSQVNMYVCKKQQKHLWINHSNIWVKGFCRKIIHRYRSLSLKSLLKNLNFGIINQSAALIGFDSQSKVGMSVWREKFHI